MTTTSPLGALFAKGEGFGGRKKSPRLNDIPQVFGDLPSGFLAHLCKHELVHCAPRLGRPRVFGLRSRFGPNRRCGPFRPHGASAFGLELTPSVTEEALPA